MEYGQDAVDLEILSLSRQHPRLQNTKRAKKKRAKDTCCQTQRNNAGNIVRSLWSVEHCFLLNVLIADPHSLTEKIGESFSKIPNIISTRTTIVPETLKEDNFSCM